MLVRESPKAKGQQLPLLLEATTFHNKIAVSPEKNSAQWPPKSPYEALLSSPSGRKRWLDRKDNKRPRTPSPSPRRAPQTNTRSPYALERDLEAPYESDREDEDEDEETLKLKLAAIEAKLKLKKLQQARDKDNPASASSTKRPPERSTRGQTSPARKRMRVEDTVQVPVSPVRTNTAPAINRSPARIILGIDKGLRAQDVSLKRARNGAAGLGPAFEKTPPRVKSFTERLADSRTSETKRAEKEERIRNARGRGFGPAETNIGRTQPGAPQSSLLESARKKASVSTTRRTGSETSTTTASQTIKTTSLTDRPTGSQTSDSDDTDIHCGLRLSKRSLPVPKLTSMMSDKELYPLTRLLREVKGPSYESPDCEADYVVFGAIASKSTPMDVKNGPKSTASDGNDAIANERKKFMVLHLTDLEWEIDLFLFGSAFTSYWKLPVGTVIAVLNPGIMAPRPHARDTGRFSLKLTSSADEVLELGKARDMGFCKARKKDGTDCPAWIDTRKTEYCSFHVELAVSKARAGRMEVNTVARSFGGRGGDGGGGRRFGLGAGRRRQGSEEAEEHAAPSRAPGPQRHRDFETGEAYYMGPSGSSAKTLLDNEDRAAPELMRQRLAKAEKERALRKRLGEIGNGAGAAYLRADAAEARQGDDVRMGDVGEDDVHSGRLEAVIDAASLGLVGRAEDVRLSPVRGRTRALHEQNEPVGWAGAFRRGLATQQKRAASPEKGQGRIDGMLQPAPHIASAASTRAVARSVSPSKKRARFMLGDKGLREPGRDSLGDMVGSKQDSDDDDLDII